MNPIIGHALGLQEMKTSQDVQNREINSEGFPCGSISSLGVLGEGSGCDLRVCPAPAASGNLGFCPLGIEVEKQDFRTAWLITGQ